MASLGLILHHLMQLLLQLSVAHGGLCAIILILGSLSWGYILYRPGYRWVGRTGATMESDIPSELDIADNSSGLSSY